MPFRDGSGPNGSGPMTGRGMGNCNPDRNMVDGYDHRGRGCGRGRGMGRRNGGRGLGYRRGYGFENFEDSPASYNKSYLESIVNYLSDKLDSYKKRLTDLDNK